MIARFTAGVPLRSWIGIALLLLALIAAPLVANDYLLTILILILYFAYVGQAWNIMMGFAGQLSLGHAIYVGLGGYTAAALYVHYGVGPWIGLLAAIPGRDGVRRDHRIPGVPLRRRRRLFRHPDHRVRGVRPHRLRPSALRRRLGRILPARGAVHAERPVEPARPAGDVLLRHPGAHRHRLPAVPRAAAQPHRIFLAGDPRGRAGGARARHRHVPLQDGGGGHLGRHDGGRRRVLRVLLQQPVSRAGLPHLALDRDHPGADHRRHRHAVRPGARRVRAHRPFGGDDRAPACARHRGARAPSRCSTASACSSS